MSYTKKEFVEQVRIALGGSGSTVDTRPLPAFIEKLIAPAINYVMTKQYYINIQQGEGKHISGLFYANYILEVKKQSADKGGKRYVDLPIPMVALPHDRGLIYAGPVDGQGEDNQFIPVNQSDIFGLKYYKQFLPSSTVQLEGQTLKFTQLSSTVKEVLVKYIASADGMDDDTVLPIPAGLEMEAITAAKNFFLGDKQVPQDKNPDNVSS